jgi:hypothetical protein
MWLHPPGTVGCATLWHRAPDGRKVEGLLVALAKPFTYSARARPNLGDEFAQALCAHPESLGPICQLMRLIYIDSRAVLLALLARIVGHARRHAAPVPTTFAYPNSVERDAH